MKSEIEKLESANEKTEVKLRELVKTSEGELIILKDFEQKKETLQKIADKYKGMKITPDNFQEGKDARAELREFRYGLQNITKHNKALIKEAKDEMVDTMNLLISIIRPTEDEIDIQIKEIENEKKLEKERQEKAEKERIANINKKISDYRVEFEKLVSFGRTEQDIEKFDQIKTQVENDINDEKFEEFEFEAENLLDEYEQQFHQLQSRVEQIKQDKIREQENKIREAQLERKNQLLENGFRLDDGVYINNQFSINKTDVFEMNSDDFYEWLENAKQEIEKIEQRKSKLILLGFSDNGKVFNSEYFEITTKSIQDKTDKEFDKFTDKVCKKIEDIKVEAEKVAEQKRAELEQEKNEIVEIRFEKLLELGFQQENPELVSYQNIQESITSHEIFDKNEIEFNRYYKEMKQKIDDYKASVEDAKKLKKQFFENKYEKLVQEAEKYNVDLDKVAVHDNLEKVIAIIEPMVQQAKTKEQERIKAEKMKIEKARREKLGKIGDAIISDINMKTTKLFTYLSELEPEDEHKKPIESFFNTLKNSISELHDKIGR